ncbi:HAD family hydrolase [Varunaivibrio sulfuroxidans]|uniref:HAD superfamily hydrolase (TIGR01509 family) n=1 Tax=Varunaivibrio sulfuroxidans TaxID=1773489 RepID=A0A4R3JHQ7_9PROT|nr:HAD family hydrolase [Varunaivibrio sulfuroxidans]TCS64796.1 HAD superfamily hydrolase (TIGR01509 family) [Varunaivibrio sulfuroxidans]WES29900.1 HAD family hydrolase [Varunaivibrio sulfuroxidans]
MLSFPIDLVIFDCDGVLVDSELIASHVLSAYLKTLGLTISPAQCRARFTGISLPAVQAHIQREDAVALPPDFEQEVRRRDLLAFERDLKAMPGIGKALKKCPFAKCVASSGSSEKIRHSLTLTHLIDYFDGHLFSAGQVAHGKPAPDLFLFAAETMAADPTHTVVIEDSLAGVQAGVGAGMRVLGFIGGGHIAPGHDARLRDAGALDVFADMTRLNALLARLDGDQGAAPSSG